MYSPRQILRGIRDPEAAADEVRSLCRDAYLSWYQFRRDTDPLDVMAAEWDTLVILDACRYDLFESTSRLPGDLRKVVSKGTGTDEFVRRNFDGGRYPDTVYVTANPHLHFIDARFHEIVRPWRTHWDERLDTVLPEVMTDRALEVHEQFPNKRIIVHYIQPHYPFVGPAGRELGGPEGYRGFLEQNRSVFHALEDGELSHEELWAAYRENLELVLPEVERLRDRVDGLTVVTSDHGNAFGEWGVYGHGGPKIPALVEVPWLADRPETRRDIVSGDATARTGAISGTASDGTVDARLESLGYL